MWNMKAKVTPVIIGATGTISKSLIQYLSNVIGKHEIREILVQKISHIEHSTHTTESANVKVQNMIQGRNSVSVAQIANTELLQNSIPYKHGLFQVRNCKYPA